MAYLLQFQINLFALASLGVLFYTVYKKTQTFNYTRKLLIYLQISTAIALVVEPLTWIFDGMTFFGAYFLEYATNFILVLMAPIVSGFILSYVDFKIFSNRKRIKQKCFYQYATFATFLLLIINFFTPILFRVNPETNHFNSGYLIWISYTIIFLFYIYMFYMIVKNSHRINRFTKRIFLIFFFLPILGMIIQTIESKLHLSWTSIVIGLYMIYLFLETNTGDFDALTKLYTRSSYRLYIKHLIEEQHDFGILFIDLNDFKKINDKYGHQVGDEVLIEFSLLLRKVFHKHQVISRLGGDEFIIVIENYGQPIENYLNLLNHLVKSSHLKIINDLTFSYGFQKHEKKMTSDDIFAKADQKMYLQKQSVKA